jgi:hypothetical protein
LVMANLLRDTFKEATDPEVTLADTDEREPPRP